MSTQTTTAIAADQPTPRVLLEAEQVVRDADPKAALSAAISQVRHILTHPALTGAVKDGFDFRLTAVVCDRRDRRGSLERLLERVEGIRKEAQAAIRGVNEANQAKEAAHRAAIQAQKAKEAAELEVTQRQQAQQRIQDMMAPELIKELDPRAQLDLIFLLCTLGYTDVMNEVPWIPGEEIEGLAARREPTPAQMLVQITRLEAHVKDVRARMEADRKRAEARANRPRREAEQRSRQLARATAGPAKGSTSEIDPSKQGRKPRR